MTCLHALAALLFGLLAGIGLAVVVAALVWDWPTVTRALGLRR